MKMNFLDCSPEVSAALAQKKAIVALESTIIAHGMPYPKNVETALRVEAMVRKHGAVPATCAIIDGRLKAGLSAAELELFGQQGAGIAKVSRRDLPLLVARKQHGATTVAATMIIAQMAGIRIFATGGIGGVHRGAPQTFDISADLQELAHTSVAVVTAGAKSILDLPLTLEYLETQGVPVLGYQTDEFPAFYTRQSGLPVDARIDSPFAVAEVLTAKWALGLGGGVVVANPIPAAHSLPPEQIESVIAAAVAEAEAAGVKGKALTPFLLARIEQMTEGNSLLSNIELVLNNAQLAAEIAVAMTN